MSWQRAAQEGLVSELEGLVQASGSVNSMVEEGTRLTPLHYSAERGHKQAVEMLLRKHAFVDAIDQYSRTPLFLATLHRHADVVRLLLQKDADPNIRCQCLTSAVSKAAEQGDRETLRLLVDAGAALNTANQDRETPRDLAARNGHVNLWEEYEERQREKLLRAAKDGNVEQVALLVGAGVETSKSKTRSSPLEVASSNGRLEVVRFLLFDEVGGAAAPAARVEAMGKTALHVAAEKGHDHVVDLILETGLSPDTPDENNNTAMHRAAARGRTGAAEVLWNRGANINAKGLLNMTPLHQAAKQRRAAMVTFLVGKGAKQEERDDMGRTYKDMTS